MIEAITYTSIVILIIIVIYQKLTIWGLESEVESKQSMINYMDRIYSKFPKVDFEYKKQNICQNLVSELDRRESKIGHIGFFKDNPMANESTETKLVREDNYESIIKPTTYIKGKWVDSQIIK